MHWARQSYSAKFRKDFIFGQYVLAKWDFERFECKVIWRGLFCGELYCCRSRCCAAHESSRLPWAISLTRVNTYLNNRPRDQVGGSNYVGMCELYLRSVKLRTRVVQMTNQLKMANASEAQCHKHNRYANVTTTARTKCVITLQMTDCTHWNVHRANCNVSVDTMRSNHRNISILLRNIPIGVLDIRVSLCTSANVVLKFHIWADNDSISYFLWWMWVTSLASCNSIYFYSGFVTPRIYYDSLASDYWLSCFSIQ